MRFGNVALACVVAGISCLNGSAWAATVFSDGFESPIVPSASFTNFSPGQVFGPWTAIGVAPVSIVSGTFSQTGIVFPAQSGSQWIDLAGQTSNSVEGVRTAVSTVSGQTYDVSFWIGNVIDPGGFFALTSTVNVLANGAPVFSGTNSSGSAPGAPRSMVWQQFDFQYLANSNSTSFSFVSGDPPSDFVTGLDNVVISTVAAVPEASTWAMTILGFAGLGFMACRRRRSTPSCALIAVILFVSLVSLTDGAKASSVLDQSYLVHDNSSLGSTSLIFPAFRRAQTFTVGLTGTLGAMREPG
jgi:hypothetical protein